MITGTTKLMVSDLADRFALDKKNYFTELLRIAEDILNVEPKTI